MSMLSLALIGAESSPCPVGSGDATRHAIGSRSLATRRLVVISNSFNEILSCGSCTMPVIPQTYLPLFHDTGNRRLSLVRFNRQKRTYVSASRLLEDGRHRLRRWEVVLRQVP